MLVLSAGSKPPPRPEQGEDEEMRYRTILISGAMVAAIVAAPLASASAHCYRHGCDPVVGLFEATVALVAGVAPLAVDIVTAPIAAVAAAVTPPPYYGPPPYYAPAPAYYPPAAYYPPPGYAAPAYAAPQPAYYAPPAAYPVYSAYPAYAPSYGTWR